VFTNIMTSHVADFRKPVAIG